MLAQVATDAQSNEITAVPKLLRMLTLKGTIVTADAVQLASAPSPPRSSNRRDDYALTLKGNQGTLDDNVVLLLDDLETKSTTA